jgi:TnpA family transposase
MARLDILTTKEIQSLYGLPQFDRDERDIYFALDPLEEQALSEYGTLVAKASFILQLGYFKAKRQFFVFDLSAVTEDTAYVQCKYFPKTMKLSDLAISKPTRLAQQAQILKLLNYQSCSQAWRQKLQEKADQVVTVYTKPIYIFKELLNFLEYHQVVLPGYSFLQEVISRAMASERDRLAKTVLKGIPEEQRLQLDGLLTAEENLYQLTLLKHEPKDFSHHEVQLEVGRRESLTDLYQLATRFLPGLNVSAENITYYAALVSYYTVQKLRQLNREVSHTYLLCFIYYRYQKVNDNLVETFMYHVNRFIDEAKQAAKEQTVAERLEVNQHLKDAGKILELFTDEAIPDEATFGSVKQQAFAILAKEKFSLVSRYMAKVTLDESAYEWRQYVRFSQRFKLNLRHLFLAIPFESQTKDDPLLEAAAFLQATFSKNKNLKDCSPVVIPQEFIPQKLRRYLYETKSEQVGGKTQKIKVPSVDKYEFLAYKLLKKGLDAGEIFIRESGNFKSFEADIIDDETWKQKDELIKSLSLPYLDKPIGEILASLKTKLEETIGRVNARIKNGENTDIKITGTGENQGWRLPYRNDDEPPDHSLYAQLPHIGVVDVMRFVHQRTGCLSVFTHALDRYAKLDADPERIIACLAAFGLNIGLRDMAENSDISYQDMVSTAHDFIRLENLKNGNDQVTNAMAKLPIFKYFNIEEDIIHGSMDGSKIDTQTATFNARNSPKYFGLGKGVSSIALIANHVPVNARIIGAHEHESRFVYDLLYNNTSDVDPQIVSTDTHGTNQVNHAILDVFGYQFAPRYKNLTSKTADICSFSELSRYENDTVKPTHKTNERLITEEWPNIQRIMVSLGLKSTTQSIIVRKLSSHLRKNRTKKALWEYDDIIRSLYTLNYIDSLQIRQNVEKALNRGEAYNRLKREVFHAHQGKFRVKTELEQNIWNECARFITNNIIYYQGCILSALLAQKEKEGKQEEVEIIKRISPVAWQNINLLGRFEFHGQQAVVDVEEMVGRIGEEIVWWQPESSGH